MKADLSGSPKLPGGLRRLLQHSFGGASAGVYRGMAALAMGSGAAKVIGVVSIPIITRLYSPEDFGVLAVFTSVVLILMPMLTLSYHLALPLPRRDAMAAAVLWLSFSIAGVATLFLAVAGAFLADWIFVAAAVAPLAPWWWLVLVATFAFATFETLSMWTTRKRAYKKLAKIKVRQAIADNLFKIVGGAIGLGALGLLIGAVLGRSTGMVVLWRDGAQTFWSARRRLTRRRLVVAAKRYAGFPCFRFPANQLTAAGQHAPALFISAAYGAATVGQFGLTMMVIALPVTLLAASMSKAYYGEVAQLASSRPSAIHDVTKGIVWRMLAISLVPAAIVILFGPQLFGLFFGERWTQAGEFARYLAPLLLVQTPASSIHFIFAIKRKEKNYLYFSIQRFFLISLVGVTALLGQITAFQFVFLYSAVMTLHYSVVLFRCMQVSGQRGGM